MVKPWVGGRLDSAISKRLALTCRVCNMCSCRAERSVTSAEEICFTTSDDACYPTTCGCSFRCGRMQQCATAALVTFATSDDANNQLFADAHLEAILRVVPVARLTTMQGLYPSKRLAGVCQTTSCGRISKRSLCARRQQ